MAELLHLTERPLWEAARAAGTYTWSTRGRTLQQEGFIHCSLRHQLPAVAAFLYGDRDGRRDPAAGVELVVLVIDDTLLGVPVRYEPAAPGAPEYPHIYGPLPVAAVRAVEPWPPVGTR
ncbi:DUF952 domain-containing protein [Actinacidiphila sp. ITFR-21]|uniref:DUF952 domain-containing protein n=1 Tax=Actinacidiphila sp. ITFR-21 TaxID=3075199 RepID=UPI002889FA72|nr:DUF952 domain-containing protein [Streptomyces sp. ITFR-21]WNI16367.1 DUF952 domain-containing protein [Streptomyces sp. ITFR-21]